MLEKNGHIVETIDPKVKLTEEIIRLKKEKNAVILSHFYVDADLQDIADFVGDSLQLAQAAATTDADMIVFVGVHFMAETAKIINPTKKVVVITSYSIHYTKLYDGDILQVGIHIKMA